VIEKIRIKIRQYRRSLIAVAALVTVYGLLGFFLAPWLVKKVAIDVVQDRFGSELKIAEVAVNPFALSLEVKGIEFDDPHDDPLLRVNRFFVNFQSSSLFRWAWTFRELHIEEPTFSLLRHKEGHFNFEFLTQAPANFEAPSESSPESGPVHFLIHDFAVRDSVLHWTDNVPPEAVKTRFGPINIAVSELNTLPARAGLQNVVITTESEGTLSWNGNLQLNPLHSEGHASIKGSHFALASAYIKHDAGFDITEGQANIELDYRVDTGDDGTLTAAIDNLELSFYDLAVKTFNEAVGREGDDREVLKLPGMTLSGGAFRWPEKMATANSFSIDDALVSLFRDENGALNVLPPINEIAEVENDQSTADPIQPVDNPWQLSLGSFNINSLALGLQDQSVEPVADIGWQSLDLEISDISNASEAQLPTKAKLVARDGGEILVSGNITVLPSVVLNLDIDIDALALAGAHPYVKSLVDVHLDSGSLNAAVALHSSTAEPFRISGDFEINDFLITETDEDSRLGNWDSLKADTLVYSTANNSLEISEVGFAGAYGDIVIAADGSFNLGRVKKDSAEESKAVPAASTDDGLAITIGRVRISDAAADFADLSLPLPFQAKIADLNGTFSTISTTSSAPSTIKLAGKVDEYGQVRVDGTITPLDPPLNTDVRVIFQNVEMPKFSAYSVPLAGRKIESGRLDLDLGYKLVDSELQGENAVVLRDFELGEKVDHPGAMSLPLGLAVALLKDADGKISIDLPVRGNVNDPEFRYGALVGKALFSLITKIVTSPFALLGNLVGAEAGELEYLAFMPGSSDLAPPEIEKLSKIAEALALRPVLVLQVGGIFDRDSDGDKLKEQAFDEIVEARITTLTDDNKVMYAEQRFAVIEQLFEEAGIAENPSLALAEVHRSHTTLTEDGSEQFDALAYTEALRIELIEIQPLGDDVILALANRRAELVRQALLTASPALASRITMDAAVAVKENDDGTLRMQIRLSADDSAPALTQEADSGSASGNNE
jgi:hypothetical protein